MGLLQEMAIRERRLWATLLVDAIVALYYFPKALVLLFHNETGLVTALVGLVIKSTMLGIVLGLSSSSPAVASPYSLALDQVGP